MGCIYDLYNIYEKVTLGLIESRIPTIRRFSILNE